MALGLWGTGSWRRSAQEFPPRPACGERGNACPLVAARRQMGDLGHDLLREEPHRLLPRSRVAAVIEAEEQQRAEAADLVMHSLDLLDHRRRRADQPIVPGAVFRR